jgi:hypothetical protein
MGDNKSAFSRDLMDYEGLEDLIAELKTIRDRESEILVEIETIIRNGIETRRQERRRRGEHLPLLRLGRGFPQKTKNRATGPSRSGKAAPARHHRSLLRSTA